MNTFEWSKINLKNKRSGQVKLDCPVCDHKKTKSLSVNIDKGVAKCHYCEAISIRDQRSITESIRPFKLPLQTWRNYTKLSNKCVKYCESRGISQATLTKMNITEETYYQPQHQRKVNNVVFNYFEGDVVVNKKYRSAKKAFTQSKDGKATFYNINSAIGSEEIYIVEGEFDVLAMVEVGIKNVISLPNGANDSDDFWINTEKYLQSVNKFYICTDNDDKGNFVSEKIAQRLGRYRCERVVFKNKDANADLIEGKDVLINSCKNSKKYPASGTFTVSDLYDDILNLHDKGLPETIYPKHPCFGELKEVFSVMRGHLCVATGIPSHGKSSFVEWYVMNLVNDYGMKASFFSPEHSPMELYKTRFIEKFYGRNFFKDLDFYKRITKKEIGDYKDWANEKIYLTAPEQGEFPKWSWLFDKFKEQLFIYGIDIFVIDAFNKVEFDKANNDLVNIRNTLTKLTLFAQMHNVIVFLIAHPKKMVLKETGLYAIPDLYSVSGSADFRNQTHDGFTIFRYFNDTDERSKDDVEFLVQKVKMKFQGDIGSSVIFKYHTPSGRYYANNVPPAHKLNSSYEEEKQVGIPWGSRS